jgi:hypothetical protein
MDIEQDAIREDVINEEQGQEQEQEQEPSEPTGRLAEIEGLAEKVRAEREEEPIQSEVDEEKDEQVPPEKPGQEAGEPEQTVKVVVDGQEREVPLSKVLDAGKRTFQKESAADRRLEEATRLLNEARQRAPQPPVQPPVQDAEEEETDLSSVVKAIQYGTEEEAAEALKKVLGAGQRKAAPTPDQVAEIAINRMRDEQILQQFLQPPDKGGFKDLTDDPYLYGQCVARVNLKRANGDTRTGFDLYKEVGDEVRAWRDGFVQKAAPSKSKQERKRSMESLPSASAKAQPPTSNERPPSPKEILAEIAKARGQTL